MNNKIYLNTEKVELKNINNKHEEILLFDIVDKNICNISINGINVSFMEDKNKIIYEDEYLKFVDEANNCIFNIEVEDKNIIVEDLDDKILIMTVDKEVTYSTPVVGYEISNEGTDSIMKMYYKLPNSPIKNYIIDRNIASESNDMKKLLVLLNESFIVGGTLPKLLSYDLSQYYILYNFKLYNIITEYIDSDTLLIQEIGILNSPIHVKIYDLIVNHAEFISKTNSVIYDNIDISTGETYRYDQTLFYRFFTIINEINNKLDSGIYDLEELELLVDEYEEIYNLCISIDKFKEILENHSYIFITHGQLHEYNKEYLEYSVLDLRNIINTLKEKQNEIDKMLNSSPLSDSDTIDNSDEDNSEN